MSVKENRKALVSQGFVVIRNFLDQGLLDTLCEQRNAVLSQLPAEHRGEYKSQGSLVNFGDHPEFSHLIGSSKIQDLITDLGPADSRWLAGYLISKPPKSPALFWHQDWWGWDHPISYTDHLPGLGVMIYLSDTCVENGCLRVIPGSHRNQHKLHSLPVAHEQTLSHIDDPDDIAYQSDASELPVEVNAGDVVLMDPRLLHSAYANTTGGERSLITLWYLPDFEGLPEAIQARYVQIFNRHDLDTGDSAAGNLLDTWPEEHRRAIEHLEPRYYGDTKPFPWNRAPDQEQMFPSPEKSIEQ
jgi:hypothetical protein